MDYLEKHPWRKNIIQSISNDISEDISEENTRWEYLDGEMVKLGSLEHELLDLNEIQQIALSLLSTESKDLRILAHLLRTLQHSASILDLLLGLQLLVDYIEHYWTKAAPLSVSKKYRLGLQIVKRFEKPALYFRQSSSRLEKDAAEKLFRQLIALLKNDKLVDDVIALQNSYLPSHVEEPVKSVSSEKIDLPVNKQDTKIIKSTNIEPIEINDSNERLWKNTLLKVVEYLIEKDSFSPIGYQLRRYTIWSGITSLPLSEANRTPLSPPSADRVAEYEAALEQPTVALWKEIEHSLTVSPYWFYGHYLSANIADKLGYKTIADAIKQSVLEFIKRLPQLVELKFNDGTDFIPPIVQDWISPKEKTEHLSSSINELLNSLENASLDKVFEQFNAREHTNVRDIFHDQLALAELLEQRNLYHLAEQYYLTLYHTLLSYSAKEWESSLYKKLAQKLNLATK